MRALVLLALIAGCKQEPGGVSQGTGGAVCSFTASGTMTNLKTTSAQTDPINDSIVASRLTDGLVFSWDRSTGLDGGCVGASFLSVAMNPAPTGPASYDCFNGIIIWEENYCDGTRGWTCATGTLTVDALTDTTIDVSIHAMKMDPQVLLPADNHATGTITLDGTCTGVRLP